jgi:hypothetical protein
MFIYMHVNVYIKTHMHICTNICPFYNIYRYKFRHIHILLSYISIKTDIYIYSYVHRYTHMLAYTYIEVIYQLHILF